MNRHRFVGEWLALLKSNVTFWPYLIWLHYASQVGVRAGTMERTSPLALPGPTTPKTSARWPKVNCPKMAPARQAVLVAATEALQWSLANHLGMPWLPMAAKFLWWPWDWGRNAAAKLVLHDFLQLKSREYWIMPELWNSDLYLPGAGYWALTWGKEINSRYSRQRIIARIPAMLATSTKYTNKILRLQSYPPKESNTLVSGFNLQHINTNRNPPKFPMSKTYVVRQDPGPVECQQVTLVRFTFTKLYAVDRLLTAATMVARICRVETTNLVWRTMVNPMIIMITIMKIRQNKQSQILPDMAQTIPLQYLVDHGLPHCYPIYLICRQHLHRICVVAWMASWGLQH